MKLWLVRALVLVLAALPASLSAVTIGQSDTFEDGTTQGWIVGLLGATSPVPPVNVDSGGPQGDDDNYLRLRSLGGMGAGSRLATLNLMQWAGNYRSNGPSAITMYLRNFGETDLTVRLLFERVGAAGPTDIAATEGVSLSAGSGWTLATFSLAPGALTSVLGSAEAAMTDAAAMRIYHSVEATFPGPAVAATLGVDDITAVPEPSTWMLLSAGLLLVGRRLSRGR